MQNFSYEPQESGLRERKKAATRTRIHKEAMRLFERQGFGETTVAEIAAAADVSARTVYVHYPTKEDIVFGDVEPALAALDEILATRPGGITALQGMRLWIDRVASGWLEPDVEFQMRLTAEVPAVAERKVLLGVRFHRALAEAIAADLGADPGSLLAEVAAGAASAGVLRLERLVVEELREGRGVPSDRRRNEILDEVEGFIAAGLDARGR